MTVVEVAQPMIEKEDNLLPYLATSGYGVGPGEAVDYFPYFLGIVMIAPDLIL